MTQRYKTVYYVLKFSDPHLQSQYKSLKEPATITIENGRARIGGLCNNCSTSIESGRIGFICNKMACFPRQRMAVQSALIRILKDSGMNFSRDRVRKYSFIVPGRQSESVTLGYYRPKWPSISRPTTTPTRPNVVELPGFQSENYRSSQYYVYKFGDKWLQQKYSQIRGGVTLTIRNGVVSFNMCGRCSGEIKRSGTDIRCVRVLRNMCVGYTEEIRDRLIRILEKNNFNFLKNNRRRLIKVGKGKFSILLQKKPLVGSLPSSMYDFTQNSFRPNLSLRPYFGQIYRPQVYLNNNIYRGRYDTWPNRDIYNGYDQYSITPSKY